MGVALRMIGLFCMSILGKAKTEEIETNESRNFNLTLVQCLWKLPSLQLSNC